MTPPPAQHPTLEIHHPHAYFAAAVSFACRIAQVGRVSMLDALMQYTGLYREVTGRQGLEGGIDPLWGALMAEVAQMDDIDNTGADAITQLLYDAYLQQPHSRYVAGMNMVKARVSGALGYVYDGAARQARMHFFAQRDAESVLATRHFHARRADFRHLLHDLRTQHPTVESVKSSTWLHNLPNYRNLFPPPFQARLKDIGGSTYLGIWGQFVKADGSGNRTRLHEFQAALAQAQTVDAVIAAFPFKVFEAVGPIQEFYAEYDL